MNKIHDAKSFKKHTFKLLSLVLIVSTAISIVAGSFSNANAVTSLDLGGEWQVSASGSNDWFSDNFVHIAPGVLTKHNLQLPKPMSKDELLETLQSKSLFSTYDQNSGNIIQLK